MTKTKEYHKWYNIKRNFGLTKEEWLAILEEQNGCCFICERKLKLRGKNTRLSANTDHCHETGKIRGILCRRCNMDIVPRFEKNIKAAKNLYTYLTRKKHYGYVGDKN